jgi:leucyl aminopeptidase (aminopeptidase T)
MITISKENRNRVVSDPAREGCRILVRDCALLQPGESAVIVSDRHTQEIGQLLTAAAREVSGNVRHHVVAPFTMHGIEPPDDVGRDMLEAAVVFGVTRMSMAHTNARSKASLAGTRYLSLPDYSMEVLGGKALRTDFIDQITEADWLADLLSRAESVRVTTRSGTDVTCDVRGRIGNSAPGVCRTPGSLASPPDVESNVPVVENGTHGTIVIDGSIPCAEIGKLSTPIVLKVENGIVVGIEGKLSPVVDRLFDSVGDPSARVVAEFGIGLNPNATLCGSMLEDEGCRGTCHFGIGSNITIGGQNEVPFHLDFVVRDAVIELDGRTIMDHGQLIKEAI